MAPPTMADNHIARMYLACLSELFELQSEGASDQQVNSFARTLIDATVQPFSIHTIQDAQADSPKVCRSEEM
jgi:hypothetical protein